MGLSKFKVVCFVQNDPSDADKGLIKVFEKETNNFIKKFLYDKNGSFETKFGYDKKNKPNFLLITKDSVTPRKLLGEEDQWDILLVCDNYAEKKWSEFPPKIFDKDTLVMYHNKPKIEGEDLIQLQLKVKKCIHTEHESLPSSGYKHLLELTKAWNLKVKNDEEYKFNPSEYDEAKKKIVEWFRVNDKLNAALEFLHNCLGNKIENTILTNAEFDLNTTENNKPSLDSLIKEYQKEFKILVLKELRDALLEIALKE